MIIICSVAFELLSLPFNIVFLCYVNFNIQFEKEEANRLSKRRLETEKPRNDATAEMSEDLFEGVKGEDAGDPSVAYGDSTTGNTPRISSFDKLYIVLIRYIIVYLTTSAVYFLILLCTCYRLIKLHVTNSSCDNMLFISVAK